MKDLQMFPLKRLLVSLITVKRCWQRIEERGIAFEVSSLRYEYDLDSSDNDVTLFKKDNCEGQKLIGHAKPIV